MYFNINTDSTVTKPYRRPTSDSETDARLKFVNDAQCIQCITSFRPTLPL